MGVGIGPRLFLNALFHMKAGFESTEYTEANCHKCQFAGFLIINAIFRVQPRRG